MAGLRRRRNATSCPLISTTLAPAARAIGVLCAARPGQQAAVRIRRIGSRQVQGFRALRFGAQTAQHIDRGGHGELRGAQSGDEHAAPDPAVLFHRLERGIEAG